MIKLYSISAFCLVLGFLACTSPIEEKNFIQKSLANSDSLYYTKLFYEEADSLIKRYDSLNNYLSKKDSSILKSCYEGTMNTAILNLRKNNSFDILWTGILSVELFEGNYKINSDTIILEYLSLPTTRIGNKLILTNDKLTVLDTTNGKIKIPNWGLPRIKLILLIFQIHSLIS